MSDVEPEAVAWLWPERIPLGKLTLIAGDGGHGKGHVTADIIARATTAQDWPDGAGCTLDGPIGALWISGEDGVADTLRPRLDAAGADVSMVHHLSSVIDDDTGARRPFRLDADIPALREYLTEFSQLRLIIVDPITTFIGDVNMNRDTEVRRALEPLAMMAEEMGVAIILVVHTNKAQTASPQHRVSGSTALVNVARKAWLVAPDPADPDRRVLAWLKGNVGRPVPSLAFTIAERGTAEETCIDWESSPCTLAAADLLSTDSPCQRHRQTPRATKRQQCQEWLLRRLAGNRVPAAEVDAEREALGYTESMVRRVREELGVAVEKAGGSRGRWEWSLPAGEDAQ